MKSIIHIDCNSFFASCEIATHEGCEDKPVIVANVNETGGGIILALNKRAKKVGLRRRFSRSPSRRCRRWPRQAGNRLAARRRAGRFS